MTHRRWFSTAEETVLDPTDIEWPLLAQMQVLIILSNVRLQRVRESLGAQLPGYKSQSLA